MKVKNLTVALAVILASTAITFANPIPWPPPASMPLEDMCIEIEPLGDGLHAAFTGDFTFTHISEDVNSMLFPVPPDANNITVWQDGNELPWTWSSELYPTILEEMPNIPMIEWQGPFPEDGAVFTVDYDHDLIKRQAEFIFFYALGTGKYFPTYEKTTTAYFDILLPAGFMVAGVWLDETCHEYDVNDSHLTVTVQSHFGPIVHDLIVSLVPTTIYVCVDGNDVTGDGSEQNPFRTIQKGIDTAVEGCTVIVLPGLYHENINFLGKNITLTSTNPTDPNVVAATIIDGGFDCVVFRGTEDPNCTLTGFNITGTVHGVDYSVDPNGENHTHATISHCLFCGNILWIGIAILEFDGTISNCLLADNMVEPCLVHSVISECHGLIKNCTIANNWSAGVWVQDGCTTTILNSIIYNNSFGSGNAGIFAGNASILNILYSNVQGGLENITGGNVNWGPGNIDADPCFVRSGYWEYDEPNYVLFKGDYYLQSSAGRWDPNAQTWVIDANMSDCIDAGDPNSDWTAELWPHGKRINMGAYGDTPQASMSTSSVGNIADLNNDDLVDYTDLMLLTGKWLCVQPLLPEDLDRDGIVNFIDFAIFAQEWSDAYLPEAGMSYQIGECGEEASALFAVEQSGQTRFTVAVEGQYIHFEDMIRANCCPGELWLEMTVDDYLITIYEFEEMEGCWCICDFPTTATLGPFADGDYLLEIIDVYGDSLGVVPVTIGGP